MNYEKSENGSKDLLSAGGEITDLLIRNKLKYQSLFEHMNTGFAYLKVEKDQQNDPCDFVVFECNTAFKRITGVTKRNIIGEKVSKLYNLKLDWLSAIYNNVTKVSLTGEPLHIETYIKKYHKYISYSVYYPSEGYIEFLVNDITEVKDIKELKRISMYFSARFINTPVGKINDEIDNALYEIGQFYDAERCCIFQYNEEQNSFECTNRWEMNDLGMSAKYEKTNLDEFEWLINQINHDRIVKITNLDELPAEAVKEREYFTYLGYKSLLFLPITYEEKVFGVIKLVTFHYEKVWPFEQIDLLRIICTIFASALKRKGMDEALQKEIDKLVKLKKVLKDSEEKYRKLTLSIQDGIIMLDSEGKIVNWNKAAETIFGYSHSEVAGRRLHQLIVPPELMSRAERNFEAFKVTGEGKFVNKVTQIHAMKKDGTRFVAEISTSTIKLKGTMHVVGIVRDITERREIQKKMLDAMDTAEAANKAKSQFLANISHEIRTPMNGIIGFMDLLAKTPHTHQQDDYIAEIKTASDVLLSLINDLLDFSKIEANKLELENIEFNLRKVMEEVTSLFSMRAYAKGIEIYARIDDELPLSVVGDPGKLKQVMENLISNAVKFTHKGKVIVTAKQVSQTEEEAEVLFSVTDTGIGISEYDIRKLFEPFTQADASTTRKFGGTGLGLTICEKLVEMMSGKIEVQSEPGEGATFSFSIRFNIVQTETKTPEYLKDLQILVADSDSTNREIVKYYLEDAGCLVTEAENGEEVIERLRDNASKGKQISVALLNYDMPDQEGLELADRIKSDNEIKDTILNLFTHYANPCDRKAARGKGIAELILKPVYKNDLYTAILASMGKAEHSLSMTTGNAAVEVIFDDYQKSHTRLLLVEDNATNQKLAISILRNAGLRCDIAENGYEALEAMKDKQYDLVLMDCQMPEMDGYEATKLIRLREEEKSHIPIIAMTANVMKSDIENCIASGMDDYISKPFRSNDLLEIIANWIHNQKSEQTGAQQKESISKEELSEDTMSDIPHILDQLALDQKIDREGIYEIYNEFVTMLPASLKKIQDAIDIGNLTEIRIGAHTLKGAAATLHLRSLSGIAAELEMQSKEGNICLCGNYLEKITEYCQANIQNIDL